MLGIVPISNQPSYIYMKQILITLLIASISAPFTFAEEGKCKDKCKEKQESTLALDGDCKDKCKDKKKEEGTLIAEADGDCPSKCKGKEKEKGTLA